MSSVLPIHTQHYESGDYTLEVTAHPSPLSQWSDRPVVRQLRFNLWVEQPQRQRLATGDQHQLVTLSDAVETYVQNHLTREAWSSTHRLQLLDQDIELSTLQLFNLAEVLNACGQQQITLPAAPAKQRPRRRWWTGSAVASLLATVGIATAYLQYRPAAFNQAETAQSPEIAFESDLESTTAPDAAPPASSAPVPESLDAPPAEAESLESRVSRKVESPRNAGLSDDAALEENRPGTVARRIEAKPSSEEAIAPESSAPPPEPRNPTVVTIPEADNDSAELDEDPSLNLDGEATSSGLEYSDAAPVQTPAASNIEPGIDGDLGSPSLRPTPEPEAAEESLDAAADDNDVPLWAAEAQRAPSGRANNPRAGNSRGGGTGDSANLLGEIATQLAPYQPTGATYPLVYHLQIAVDGTIETIEPIGDAPAIALPGQTITPTPGRSLKVELIYTGVEQPAVRELFE